MIKYVCNEIKVCKVFDFQWSNGAREKGYDEDEVSTKVEVLDP